MPNTPNKNLPYPAPSDPADVPTDIGELALALDALPSPAAAWQTGDTKVSAKPATHADPQGGTWYLADGSAIPAGNPGLVALLGANFPDGRGRALTMVGTHADVNAIGKTDGEPIANRRFRHGHSFSLTVPQGNVAGAGPNAHNDGNVQQAVGVVGTIGPASARPLDGPASVVAGNLFYHS